MPTTVKACLAALLALACGLAAVAGARAAGSDRILVVGRVTSNPQKDYPAFKQLADYLVAHLADQGMTGSRVQFADDNATMVALLRDGAVDLVTETIFSALTYVDDAGAKVILRERRDGVANYHTVLFARADSGITGLSDLPGKTIAFEDRGSTTAYFVPLAELTAAGLGTVELTGTDQKPPPDAVGYLFAGSENNIVAWVHRGRVHAGAFSNIDWGQENDVPAELRKHLTIFHRSAPIPRSVVVVRGDLPGELERRIAEVMVNAAEDPAGQAALKAYKRVARYDELTGEVADAVAAARRMFEANR